MENVSVRMGFIEFMENAKNALKTVSTIKKKGFVNVRLAIPCLPLDNVPRKIDVIRKIKS